jgi:hypothetical protein
VTLQEKQSNKMCLTASSVSVTKGADVKGDL